MYTKVLVCVYESLCCLSKASRPFFSFLTSTRDLLLSCLSCARKLESLLCPSAHHSRCSAKTKEVRAIFQKKKWFCIYVLYFHCQIIILCLFYRDQTRVLQTIFLAAHYLLFSMELFKVRELISNLPARLATANATSDRIFVGTTEGQVISFVAEKDEAGRHTVSRIFVLLLENSISEILFNVERLYGQKEGLL